MERTRLFQEHVKFLKARKTTTATSGEVVKLNKKSEFIKRIEIILSQISELRTFLLNYRDRFLKLTYDSITSLAITDVELEKVDMFVQRITERCSNLLKELSSARTGNNADQQTTSQYRAHQTMLVDLVKNYLTALHKLYLDNKSIWMKRHNQYRNMILIASNNDADLKSRTKLVNNKLRTKTAAAKSNDKPDDHHGKSETDVGSYSQDISKIPDYELKILDSENTSLFDELNGLLSEVGSIEKKVSSMAELQDLFTTEILQQDNKIQRIDNTVSGVSQNIQDANSQLRQAMQNNASLRIYLLVFILGLSFGLLFLNWYNE